MKSIWERSLALPRFPSLDGDIKAEAAVIGGGMTGLLTAWALQEKGIGAVVLEAGRIAGGQTGKTTAKITAQHGALYHRLSDLYGPGFARLYGQANQEAIGQYAGICQALEIDCDFAFTDAYVYSAAKPDVLVAEEQAAQAAGLPAEFVRELPLPLACAGAIRFQEQAQFHPLKFLNGLAPHLRIYEHTPALAVHGQTVETPRGVVQADHIIFACHFPIIDFPGFYFARMHQVRSYVLALENAPRYPGMYISLDQDGLSFRSCGPYLLLGGKGHRTGQNAQGGQYTALEIAAKKLFPGCRIAAEWSAQDCVTPDGVPYIGRYAAGKPNWFAATGFNKWGMTSAMVSARLLTSLISTGDSPYADIFSKRRFSGRTAPGVLSELGTAVKGLSKANFLLPEGAPEGLLPDCGGVVSHKGKQVCAYRARDGRLYTLSARCPHLGCRLEWNPEERTWDCPCHGSRFDYTGALLASPAKKAARELRL